MFKRDWRDLPPLSALRAFEASARHASFSDAARELNVTPQAVSQQVRSLETRLECVLMKRGGQRLILTEEGAELARGLREGFATMLEAIYRLRKGRFGRPVHVSLTSAFAASWLMPRLSSFREKHPDVELMLNPSPHNVDLLTEDYDFAIRYGTGPWPKLESQPLIVTPVAVVGAPSLLDVARPTCPEDLLHLPWIQELGIEEWRRWFEARGIAVGDKSDVYHLPGQLALQALVTGQGIGLMATALVQDRVASGELIALFGEDLDRPDAGYYIVHRPGRLREPARLFCAWLRENAAIPFPA